MGKKSKSRIGELQDIQTLRNRLIGTMKAQGDLSDIIDDLQLKADSYRQIIDLLPEVVFEVDLDFNFTFVNRRGIQIAGYSEQYILNEVKAYDLVIPEEKELFISGFNRILNGQYQPDDIFTIVSKDGQKFNMMIHVRPVRENGKIISLRGVATDITEKLLIRQELSKEKDLLRSILATANSIIICLDGDANILVFNNECERITGYKREEVLGKCWPEIFVPEEYRWPSEYTFAEWVRIHPRDRYECPLITKSGELRNIFWSNSSIISPHNDEIIAIAIGFDVTDFKQTKDELTESEQRYQTLLEQSNDAIYMMVDDRFEFVNDRFVKMFGYSKDELLSPEFSYMNLVSPESMPLIKQRLDIIKQGRNPPRRYEYIGVRKDGIRIHLDVSISYVTIKNKRVVQGIYRDITERKMIEEKLKLAHNELNQIFKAATPMIVIDKDYTIRKINPAYSKLFKTDESAIVGKKCIDLYRSQLCDGGNCPMKKLLGGLTSYEYEDTTVLENGNGIESHVTAQPYRSIDGEFLGIVECYLDITARKNAERALKEGEERYRAVWENSPVAICLTDIKCIYRYVNPAYCKLYGYKEEELIGKNFVDLIYPPEKKIRPAEKYRRSFEQGIPSPLSETQFMRKDGTRIWVQYTGDYVYEKGKPKYKVSMNIDVTDRKKAEQELLDSRTQFKVQFKASPIPTYTWRKTKDNFILLDYNDAAFNITEGKIADFAGIKVTDLYADEPEIVEDIRRCYREKSSFSKEYLYHYRSTKKFKFLVVGISYAPPDLVIVHTEDITQRRESKMRNAARLNLLQKLRIAETEDECLELGCKAIYEAGLYKRSVLTLHNDDREIEHLGQYGLEPDTVDAARDRPAPNEEITKNMLQEKHRISNSYFIPVESGLELDKLERHIRQDETLDVGEMSWQKGDELFVPIIGDLGKIIGWLSVDTPFNGRRPNKDIIQNLEEITAIVMKRVQSIQHLKLLNAEKEKLVEKNVTLKELLTFIQKEKHTFRRRISDTVEQILLPNLEKVKRPDGTVNESYFDMLTESLKELSVTMGNEIPVYSKLSSREAEICQMIRAGATSKSIADRLHVTVGTVQKHREKIRKKLGISNKSINLANYLKNL